jgi:hypothetical protein
MALKETLGMKFVATDTVVNPKPSKRLKKVEPTVASEI